MFDFFEDVGEGVTDFFSNTLSLGSVMDIFASSAAVIIYLCIILAVIAVLIITIMVRENKNAEKIEYRIIGDVTGINEGTAEKSGNEAKDRDERFCMLSEIDKNKSIYTRTSYDRGIDLERLCENFRNYAASRLKLYYDIEDIRRFIAGMSVSHILILQGMSGTGKTSLAHAFGSFIDNSSTVIPVQPMW